MFTIKANLASALASLLLATQFSVFAQSNVVILTLEQSTNMLGEWQAIQVTTNTVATTNGFYRMKISSPPTTNGMVAVQGDLSVASFQIGRCEVTWNEWQDVRAWAVTNGYSDLDGIGAGSAGDHPVRNVNWYDVAKWMNARSEREGLSPVYLDQGAVYRTGEVVPTLDADANGYRLPTEAEWKWAARGGAMSQDYTYSGSNDVNEVAWYFSNSLGAVESLSPSGRGTWPVGSKAANELGIHDMSGNVWEWCEDFAFDQFSERVGRGGSWRDQADSCSTVDYADDYNAPNRDDLNATNRYNFFGFRVVRNAP